MAFPWITPYSVQIAVLGAGTMGSGIALAALQANLLVTLYEVSPPVLETARAYIEKHLIRKGQGINLRNLTLTDRLEDLHSAQILIEAVPEDLKIKLELFERLDQICPPPAILATNTSTLSVTAIAAAVNHPERVAGIHFFNPAPVMPLVEIIRGARTQETTLQTLLTLAEKMGKTAVIARDTPGFIVNRVARPFYGEALRLLSEGIATHEQIDRLVRLGAGFRMGPFELMDLIGIDINLAATQSVWEQSFYEARYRPHPLQAVQVQQKALGRKTGHGFYSYEDGNPIHDPPLPPHAPKLSGWAVVLQPSEGGKGLQEKLARAEVGLFSPTALTRADASSLNIATGFVLQSREEESLRQAVSLDRLLPPELPLFIQCVDQTLGEVAAHLRYPQRAVGLDSLFFGHGPAITLVTSPLLDPLARAQAERFFRSLGQLPIWVEDGPGLVLPRIVAMLTNEAAFAVGDAVADSATIDRAMQLGTNYPFGPLAWAESVGYERVVAILDHLHTELKEERYRAAPILRRWARWQRAARPLS